MIWLGCAFLSRTASQHTLLLGLNFLCAVFVSAANMSATATLGPERTMTGSKEMVKTPPYSDFLWAQIVNTKMHDRLQNGVKALYIWSACVSFLYAVMHVTRIRFIKASAFLEVHCMQQAIEIQPLRTQDVDEIYAGLDTIEVLPRCPDNDVRLAVFALLYFCTVSLVSSCVGAKSRRVF